VHGVWLETSLPDAQINVVTRMLAVHGRLLEPRETDCARDPSALPPHALFRTSRAIERPSPDEGFASLETIPFARRAAAGARVRGRLVALDAVLDPGPRARGPARALLADGDARLVFGWRPGVDADWAARAREALRDAGIEAHVALCPHAGGPPRCWCRPPLPGLLLAFAEAEGVDLARSVVVGTSPAHETLARALGASYERV
jgi:hypothetical protein